MHNIHQKITHGIKLQLGRKTITVQGINDSIFFRNVIQNIVLFFCYPE